MDNQLFEQLHSEGILSGSSLQKIKEKEANRLFSVHWEIKTLMYLGVLLLSAGLGILIYKNIDSIGHNVILLFLILLCAGSFYYCFKQKLLFSVKRVASPNALFDYLLLLACLSFITIIAYLQYQYNFFGNRYGLASFIPMTVLFLSAYYFDNIGILSLAITNLAAWLGITVTPLEILKTNDFNDTTIILTGLLLGAFLITVALISVQKNFKKHFQFTYTNFGMHILFISCIAAMLHFENVYLLWFLLLMGMAFYFYTKALSERSFYILLITTLYAYFGITYVAINLLSMMRWQDLGPFYLGFIYFIASGIGLVLFLIRTNKKIKANDSI